MASQRRRRRPMWTPGLERRSFCRYWVRLSQIPSWVGTVQLSSPLCSMSWLLLLTLLFYFDMVVLCVWFVILYFVALVCWFIITRLDRMFMAEDLFWMDPVLLLMRSQSTKSKFPPSHFIGHYFIFLPSPKSWHLLYLKE